MAKMADTKIEVSLSRRDRLLLKRIADALNPVTEPKSGPRRLVEPVSVLEKLASANEDDRIALTAGEVVELSTLKRLLGQSKIEGVE